MISSIGLLVIGVVAVIPGAGHADPPRTVEEAARLIDQLNSEAEEINEHVNDLQVEAGQLERRLAKLETDIARQQERVDALRDQIGQYAAGQYRAGAVDLTVQLLLSDDPDEFLAHLTSAKAFEGQQGHTLTQLQAEEKKLAEQQAEQRAQLARQRELEKQAVEDLKVAEAKVAEADEVYDTLAEEERQRLAAQRAAEQEAARQLAQERASRSSERTVTSSPTGSGRGAIALAFAESQLGDAYVFGADGLDTYDCSGLTMTAWAEAGVSLPHSSSKQFRVGTQISRDQLQAGDLVFFYSDLHHVGIYAGDGQIIHAPRPGKVVEYISISSMPYAGAARPG